MVDKCQYCFKDYDSCTCCQFCSALENTCDCKTKKNPCTVMSPHDAYKVFYKNPEICAEFGMDSLDDIDNDVMKMYKKDYWPERLKNK